MWEEGRKKNVMTKAFECCSVTGQGSTDQNAPHLSGTIGSLTFNKLLSIMGQNAHKMVWLVYNQFLSFPYLCHKVLPGGCPAQAILSGEPASIAIESWCLLWGQRNSVCKRPTCRTEPSGSLTMRGSTDSGEVDVNSLDVEGEWTVWGLVLNPLEEIHYILHDTLLSLKWK